MDLLGLLDGLVSGAVLICEQYVDGALKDRWLIHKTYNDEFDYLDVGEVITVRRARVVHR